MTLYKFIASNEKLQNLEIGVERKGVILDIPNPNEYLNIFIEDKYTYLNNFTDSKYIYNVETWNFANNKHKILEYIKSQMSNTNVLELWSVWLDDKEIDSKTKSIKFEDFNVSDLEWVFDIDEFIKPRGLRIYKWYRGKK